MADEGESAFVFATPSFGENFLSFSADIFVSNMRLVPYAIATII
jgi:hypothetical protein